MAQTLCSFPPGLPLDKAPYVPDTRTAAQGAKPDCTLEPSWHELGRVPPTAPVAILQAVHPYTQGLFLGPADSSDQSLDHALPAAASPGLHAPHISFTY